MSAPCSRSESPNANSPPARATGRPGAGPPHCRWSRPAEAQHGDLPGVPVLERIPGKQLAQVVVACGVPAGRRPVGCAGQRSNRGRRAEQGENAFTGDHLQEIVIPGRVVAFCLQGCVTLGLEEAAHGQQCAASRLVVMSGVVGGGLKSSMILVTPGGGRGGGACVDCAESTPHMRWRIFARQKPRERFLNRCERAWKEAACLSVEFRPSMDERGSRHRACPTSHALDPGRGFRTGERGSLHCAAESHA